VGIDMTRAATALKSTSTPTLNELVAVACNLKPLIKLHATVAED